MNKLYRQVNLYIYIRSTKYHSPSELMDHFNIGQRMLQRDLKDLRECGLLFVKYDKTTDNYVEADASEVKFPEAVKEYRRKWLKRLYRLGRLTDHLTITDNDKLLLYESLYEEYYDYIELVKEDPNEYPAEYIGELPEKPEFADTKAEYYELFPDGNERTRARDFAALTDIGWTVRYSPRYRAFLVGPEIDPDEERHWICPSSQRSC